MLAFVNDWQFPLAPASHGLADLAECVQRIAGYE